MLPLRRDSDRTEHIDNILARLRRKLVRITTTD